MWHRFHAARFQCARHDHRVHAYARHRPAVDVDGVHLLRSHHAVHLLIDAVERDALGRIDFHADSELFILQPLPELAFWIALLNRHSGLSRCHNRCRGVLFCGAQRFHHVGHRADMRGRGSAASRANSAKYCGEDFGYTMRSPSRLGNPALGMPLMQQLGVFESSCRIGSSDCGPSVQFAPITWTFLSFKREAARKGRTSPNVVPSSEYVSCATIGRLENERIASMASRISST